MCGSKPKVDTSYQDEARAEAARLRVEEQARQARINAGMSQIGQVFSGIEPVLDQRRAAMESFYVPQLDKQFSNATDELTYALSRAGQGTSSTAGKKQGDLSEAFALKRAGIEADINSDVASTRTAMNNQRAAIEAGLRASGDQTQASNAALASAVTFRDDAPTLNPLGDIFYGVAEGIGAVRDGYEAGSIRRRLSVPSPTKGTGKVIVN